MGRSGSKRKLSDFFVMVIRLKAQLSRRWHVSLFDLFLLDAIRSQGREFNGRMIFLNNELVDLAEANGYGGYTLTKALNKLHDKGIVKRLYLSREERLELFGPSERMSKLAVTLTTKGTKVLDQISEAFAAEM